MHTIHLDPGYREYLTNVKLSSSYLWMSARGTEDEPLLYADAIQNVKKVLQVDNRTPRQIMDKTLKLRLLRERGPMCELCHVRPFSDMHHALIHRDKRFPELDTEENFCLLCQTCHLHNGYVNSYEFKCAFWKIQCQRYSVQRMELWLKSLPLKSKPIFPN